jgi:hypothetical protein
MWCSYLAAPASGLGDRARGFSPMMAPPSALKLPATATRAACAVDIPIAFSMLRPNTLVLRLNTLVLRLNTLVLRLNTLVLRLSDAWHRSSKAVQGYFLSITIYIFI